MTGKIIQRGSGSSNRGSMSLLKRNRSLLINGAFGFPAFHQKNKTQVLRLALLAQDDIRTGSRAEYLVDWSLRKVVTLRLQVQGAEGLFVLGEILAENVPEGLGLLRAQKDGRVIADGDLLGVLAGGQAEDKLKIPYADAHLDLSLIHISEPTRQAEISY